MKIFCVIPAYNEAENIAEVITNVKPLVDEVVVVDDCSADDTVNLAKLQGAVVLRHEINRGQGAALQTGNEYAIMSGADVVVHFDADGQFSHLEITEVIEPLISGEYDIVFGSRFLGKHSDIPWFKKSIILPSARAVNRLFFNIKLTDPQSGFRAMSREAVMDIEIENDRMAHCTEIIAKAVKNWRIVEVPITVTYRDFGQRFSGGLRIIKDLFLAKFLK